MLDKNVLLLESVSDEADQLLRENVSLFRSTAPDTGGEIASIHEIHAIITRGKGQVNQGLIDACSKLQLIARCGVGLDNVDVVHASSRGVKVVNAPGINADTVAEHALGLMLSLQRKLYHSFSAVKNNQWDYRKSYDGDEIRGKTLGILGMGNIGQKVARLAQAFGMEIIYWDIHPKDVSYPFVTFEEVLSLSHILSLHLPLVKETHKLINAEAISHMNPYTILINSARGAIIDEHALTEALQQNKIAGFGADVLEVEPPSQDHPLLGLENTLITPHSASLTAKTYNEMCVVTVQNTLSLLRGDTIHERFIFNRASL
ncbi:MAG: hydroxyacid dehydrogenase [Bacteroidota bacterium]